MHLLLIDTTTYSPVSPIFSDALDEWTKAHNSTWRLADERYWSRKKYLELDALNCDVLIVMKGVSLGPVSLENMKRRRHAFLVCYATDDPFNTTVCQQNIRDCIPLYDLYVTCKTSNMDDLKKAGAQRVEYLPVGYKPSCHFPEQPANDKEREHFASDICIIGGADAERIATVKKILTAFPNNTIALYGGYWDRDVDTAKYHRGFAYGRDYRLAIGGAKVCVNLLRKANRDQHNMRTFEIPACGGVQLTQATQEHQDIGLYSYHYHNEDMMLVQIHDLLTRDKQREELRTLGTRYVQPHTYQVRLEQLMKWVPVCAE